MTHFADNYAESLAYRLGLGDDRADDEDDPVAEDEKNLPVEDTILLTSYPTGGSIQALKGAAMLRGCVETGCSFITLSSAARYCPIDGGELVTRQCECGNYTAPIQRYCEMCGREVAYAAAG